MSSPDLDGRIALITGAAEASARRSHAPSSAPALRVALCDTSDDGLVVSRASSTPTGRSRCPWTCRIRPGAATASPARSPVRPPRCAGQQCRDGDVHGARRPHAPGRADRGYSSRTLGPLHGGQPQRPVLHGPRRGGGHACPELGRIINVTTSFFTMLNPGFAPYGPAKSGLEAWSTSLAGELKGTGITVNVVVPGGPTDTPMVPDDGTMKRSHLIRPEKMALPMLHLASDAGVGVTGMRFVAAEWDRRCHRRRHRRAQVRGWLAGSCQARSGRWRPEALRGGSWNTSLWEIHRPHGQRRRARLRRQQPPGSRPRRELR